jgi:hypothetical protein
VDRNPLLDDAGEPDRTDHRSRMKGQEAATHDRK